MYLFDAHTHIDLKHYQHDREQVIDRAKRAGLVGLVTSSMSVGSFRHTLGITKKYQGYVYQSAGCSVSQLTQDETDAIIQLTRKYAKNIVAIGEVGLDYHWIKDSMGRKAQEPRFLRFIELSEELNLPIVIHSRKAEAEATAILEQHYSGDVLMHCYDGPPEVTKRIIDNDWHITLPAIFNRYKFRLHAAKAVPLERVLLETDGPYLSPTNERNEPCNIAIGCRTLAELLGQSEEYIGSIITANAKRFYQI